MAASASSDTARRFGTFGGVFTPSTLTILGVIMFLRYGEVVGQAGVLNTILILAGAKAITTLTGLSLAAIATNTKVKGGGAYFLISRSLGVEFGGSIGIVFFLAQAVSVAMYVIGFTEALMMTFPGLEADPRMIASLVNGAIFTVVMVGAGWAIKVQYAILAALALSLLSFAWGALDGASAETLAANWTPAYREGSGFFLMFALFFPAVTGIMAGANMSGDLREPNRAIPRGTLASIAVTGLVYLGMALLLGAAASREQLLGDTLVVRTISRWPLLITAGVFAATLSSALGSMMGAPRILQAVARDRIFPSLGYFGAGSGASAEPRRATALSFLIAQAGILLGDLDLIAPIIAMFFMVTYGYLNLATFYEAWTRNPSYRPTFRYTHWSMSLLGAAACAGVMMLISPVAATASVVLMGLLHWSIARRELGSTWGDVRQGALFERTRRALLKLESEEGGHAKNWRPNVLALAGTAGTRDHVSAFGHWLAAWRGTLSLGQVIVGDLEKHVERVNAQEKVLRSHIRDEELDAFPAVVLAPRLADGVTALITCHGLGAMRPNLVLKGWSENEERQEDFFVLLRTVAALKRDLVLLRASRETEADPWRVPPGPVDVWWRGHTNGPLMVLLAHLLVQDPAWVGHKLRLLRVVPTAEAVEETRQHLLGLLAEARVEAEAMVVVAAEPVAAIRRMSAASAAVFLGFDPPAEADEERFHESMEALMEGLGTILLVSSSGGAALEA